MSAERQTLIPGSVTAQRSGLKAELSVEELRVLLDAHRTEFLRESVSDGFVSLEDAQLMLYDFERDHLASPPSSKGVS